ncbi:hypothetical protein [Chengkuizengella axinellae]|uniref:DUF4489 domain-containing protein n=1 Tax=Chengkuizengella axinellae TaxID=3064388 RepID=A0ABT9J190_9BACL|nr:hypothetical protein [Chengkuizengella sp. 2205SS18-9]MDP5275380.1 hypothetical protein [Chengkuizengella sp. 2205SS18-9]
MGLNKGPFIVSKSISVDDPYDTTDPDVILLPKDPPGSFEDVLTIDVCVKQPGKTKVRIDSMAQIAVNISTTEDVTPFQVTYEVLRNNQRIALINDQMQYDTSSDDVDRHNNFPNYPIIDNNPDPGINQYVLRCTDVLCVARIDVTVGSRSLVATVFESK